MLPKSLLIPEAPILRYKNKQAFLVGKTVLTVLVPILINKDVFEPNYNNSWSKTSVTFVPT